MKWLKRKPKLDPRLVELEAENRALRNQTEYLVRTIRGMDDVIFKMGQCKSWEQMRPAFAALKDEMTSRKVIESRRITELLNTELVKTYQPLGIEHKQ